MQILNGCGGAIWNGTQLIRMLHFVMPMSANKSEFLLSAVVVVVYIIDLRSNSSKYNG